MKEGWNYILGSPKWHYFRGGQSLCRKWMMLGSNADAEDGDDDSPDNCKACARIRKKEKE